MKGDACPLIELIEGNRVQFIIPVYQRNYDWQIKNCEQLLDDLEKLSKSPHRDETHFFGSIVTARAGEYGSSRLVIDGQQRITTVSLLLLAGIAVVKEGQMTAGGGEEIVGEVMDIFLTAKHCPKGKIKLVPIENDKATYDSIFHDDRENFVEGAKMTKNYRHFHEQLAKGRRFQSFDQLWDAVKRLQIISIELGENDDAQLIFESLNSTGLALTEADQVRNYMLMSLSAEEQETYFKGYWQKIERAADHNPTMFLRDYLTIMQQSTQHVKEQDLYAEWKKYMRDKDRKAELAQMLDYARYYQQILTCRLTTPALSEKMSHIGNIGTDTCNVFFVQFLRYASVGGLAEEEICRVIDLVENYFARRIVCATPSNALTKVFCALHKEVLRSIEELRSSGAESINSYSDILAFHLLRRKGNERLPDDEQFKAEIHTHNAYKLPKPHKVFLFERLENWQLGGEYVDVAEDFRNNKVTIEHIMPQKLSTSWKAMLGDDYERIQERYLHTFANLTLSGVNSKLSNKPFEEKRDGKFIDGKYCEGYKDSKYRLTTKYVTSCQKWTENELEQRGRQIEQMFLHLYPLPKTDFHPRPKPMMEVPLDDETFSPTSQSLKGFRLFGEEHDETVWVEMQKQVCREVMERCPDKFEAMFDKGDRYFVRQGNESYCFKIGPGRYVYTSLDNKEKLILLRRMFKACNIPESELVMILEPLKENTRQKQAYLPFGAGQ